jgi:hypothetical protein
LHQLDYIFLHFCPEISDWIIDIMNFAFLAVVYFYIPLNKCEICSRIKKLLGNCVIFLDMFLLGKTRTTFILSQELTNFEPWAKYSPQAVFHMTQELRMVFNS